MASKNIKQKEISMNNEKIFSRWRYKFSSGYIHNVHNAIKILIRYDILMRLIMEILSNKMHKKKLFEFNLLMNFARRLNMCKLIRVSERFNEYRSNIEHDECAR